MNSISEFYQTLIENLIICKKNSISTTKKNLLGINLIKFPCYVNTNNMKNDFPPTRPSTFPSTILVTNKIQSFRRPSTSLDRYNTH